MTQELCENVVFEDPLMLKPCHDRYKTQEICDKSADSYLLPLRFILDWFVTDICPFVPYSVPDRYMTQELCENVVFEDPLMLKPCHDRYKTQEICDKSADSYLLPLRFILDWFATNKIIEKLDSAIFSGNYIAFADLDSVFVTFLRKDIGLNIIALENINLENDNFDYCDPETINDDKPMGWHNKYKQRKASKIK